MRLSALLGSLAFSAVCILSPLQAADVPGMDDDPMMAENPDMPPVLKHGALSVEGNRIVGVDGEPVSLAGVSWFWSTVGWGAEKWYNKDAVSYVVEDFDAGLVRAAIATGDEGGFESHPKEQIAMAEAVVEGAIAEDVYVLIDWHSHHAEDNPDAAIAFFTHMAAKYGDQPHVIYEIYNEPLMDTDWEDTIKPYAEEVIAAIRAVDPDNLIVVGTRMWSQRVDEAAADPIEGDNIAYTLHFYAGTHKQGLRDIAQTALDDGAALFVTEWGSVNADGDGDIDRASVAEWVAFMKENDLSMANWSLHDKKEGASILKPGASPIGGWTEEDYTEAGLFVRDIVRNWDDTPAE